VVANQLDGLLTATSQYSSCRAAGIALVVLFLLGACASKPPSDTENICHIFEEKGKWYKAAKKSEKKWGTPVHVQMAIMRQESKFQFDAKPPRTKKFGFIPWKRKSSAYGFAQVKDETWKWYKDKTGNRGADRDDFSDAIDFVGWYTNLSQKTLGISKWDPKNQYLAYHEGHGGFKRKTYNSKAWLIKVAQSVDHLAKEWGVQLKRCEDDLNDGWWIFG
jgi:hypothetical protein